jgi:hypothetical protein
MEAWQKINIQLQNPILCDNVANASVTITGSYTKYEDAVPDISDMPPCIQFVTVDGSVLPHETGATLWMYGESSVEVSIPSGYDIAGIRLTCGAYDVDFTDCVLTVSVKQWKENHVAVPIKEIVLYKDMVPIGLKRTIPEGILALPCYGLGVSETHYNYIDFDAQTYVQMCNYDGALATPVVMDISALLTDFDGTIEVDGADMISFEAGEGMLHWPMPYKFMYHSKV